MFSNLELGSGALFLWCTLWCHFEGHTARVAVHSVEGSHRHGSALRMEPDVFLTYAGCGGHSSPLLLLEICNGERASYRVYFKWIHWDLS